MVDFAYYTEQFGGTVMDDSADFDRFAKKAEAYLKSVAKESVEGQGDAICAVAEMMFLFAGREGTASVSNDGYSESYLDGAAHEAELYRMALRYLSPETLYRGI